jgi:hypothetical protein
LLAAVSGWLWHVKRLHDYISYLVSNNSSMDQKKTELVKASKTDVDTSKWKLYRNEEYGLEVKYPPTEDGWTLREYDNSESSLGGRSKGVRIQYDYQRVESSSNRGEAVDISFIENRYDNNLVKQLRNPEGLNIFSFHFNGYRAASDVAYRKDIEAFFGKRKCSKDILFVLLDLPKQWDLGGSVSIECDGSYSSEKNREIIHSIAETVRFPSLGKK